ncbi:hypothetical protein FWJ25_01825 [Marinobacter salinexigens]|uniref:Lipoprotein n=1 Tax=Marinobacter salinexigens TaxID=2919747 RepID=A0A5B0VMT0_9GAMM|nr:flagellar assembly protein T N-terminal domain-containing protein [Marinobacter salinexigens]KAA1175896.1 hypothetical protein FWJ25_01825 [Marinobacter salinexigens]
MKVFLGLMVMLVAVSQVQAVVLEGVGSAVIYQGDLEAARAKARQAALRDLSLQYEARVSTSDTMENGVLTGSRTEVASRARARNVRVVDETQSGNRLRIVVRADVTEGAGSCGAGDASHLRKRVAVMGFPMIEPSQARLGRLDDAGERLPQRLQQKLRETGQLQVLGASSRQLFSEIPDAPTSMAGDNALSNVVQVARELGAQFVVTGVIRDMEVSDPSAWGTSVWDGMKRTLWNGDQSRRFVVDLMVFDGFSGSPVYRQRFATSADWDASTGSSDGFGSGGFQASAYGRAVDDAIDDMALAVNDVVACQPFMTRITRVDGDTVTLESGATAGLRPGDELHLYRSARYWNSLGGTPELSDARQTVTLNNVHPDFSNGSMSLPGGQLNIQRDDVAIIW